MTFTHKFPTKTHKYKKWRKTLCLKHTKMEWVFCVLTSNLCVKPPVFRWFFHYYLHFYVFKRGSWWKGVKLCVFVIAVFSNFYLVCKSKYFEPYKSEVSIRAKKKIILGHFGLRGVIPNKSIFYQIKFGIIFLVWYFFILASNLETFITKL